MVEGGQNRQTRRREEAGRLNLRSMDDVEMDVRRNMVVKRWRIRTLDRRNGHLS
jgi:hypothetical protein